MVIPLKELTDSSVMETVFCEVRTQLLNSIQMNVGPQKVKLSTDLLYWSPDRTGETSFRHSDDGDNEERRLLECGVT